MQNAGVKTVHIPIDCKNADWCAANFFCVASTRRSIPRGVQSKWVKACEDAEIERFLYGAYGLWSLDESLRPGI